MRCPECRHIVEGAPEKCPECGARLPRPKGRQCPTCGAPVSRRADCCFMCGAELEPRTRPAWRWLADLAVVAVAVGLVAGWFLHPWSLPTASPPSPTATPTATPVPTGTPTRPPTSTPRPTSTATLTATPRPETITHTVESGDTLSSLAEVYGVSVGAIREASRLGEDDLLRVGQVITVPLGSGETATGGVRPTTTTTPYIYVVQAGEGLLSIAARFQTTVDEIMALNELESADLLREGQELVMPGPPPPPGTPTNTPTALPPEARRYVVQPGDTLLGIAEEYGASMEVLMTVNEIEDPAALQIGQELVIIPGTPTPEPTATPLPPPTSTPGPPFPAPALLWPPDGGQVPAGGPALLTWSSVGLLSAQEWYLVRVWPVDQPDAAPTEALVRSTSWHLPSEMAPGPGEPPRRLRWEVWVVEAAEVGAAGAESQPEVRYLSAPGPSRVLIWGD